MKPDTAQENTKVWKAEGFFFSVPFNFVGTASRERGSSVQQRELRRRGGVQGDNLRAEFQLLCMRTSSSCCLQTGLLAGAGKGVLAACRCARRGVSLALLLFACSRFAFQLAFHLPDFYGYMLVPYLKDGLLGKIQRCTFYCLCAELIKFWTMILTYKWGRHFLTTNLGTYCIVRGCTQGQLGQVRAFKTLKYTRLDNSDIFKFIDVLMCEYSCHCSCLQFSLRETLRNAGDPEVSSCDFFQDTPRLPA